MTPRKPTRLRMTAADEKVYNYLVIYITHYMCSPSIRNICIATGLHSTSSVHARLNKLERLGVIERIYDENKRAVRNIKLTGYKLIKHNEETNENERDEIIS